jgi:hypothetical protein
MNNEIVPIEKIENKIFVIRGRKVMMDFDLSRLYCIETRALKQAVKRNPKRFPADFVFILTNVEVESLVSQNVIPSKSYFGGSAPFAFTEQGVAMLSSVLNSDKAIQVNVLIMRAFVKFRQLIANNMDLSKKLEQLEKRLFKHDSDIRGLVRDIRRLSLPKHEEKSKKIGFV